MPRDRRSEHLIRSTDPFDADANACSLRRAAHRRRVGTMTERHSAGGRVVLGVEIESADKDAMATKGPQDSNGAHTATMRATVQDTPRP
jgi:hypothetical protein